MNAEDAIEDETQKKGRRRKKQLYSSILQQMEFYFSDSNLAKDRFLAQLTQQDPYIDISIFLKFNKLRKLTTSIKDITKAIMKSDLLELSEDKTKVKRKLPVTIKENVEECTLYVERLKSDATHEWLNTIFSEFGKVTYVSIPKYKNSGMIKGFAFVEFDKETSVQAALQYFENIGCVIPSCMEPEKLCSIVAFNIEANATTEENSINTCGSTENAEPFAKKLKLEEELKETNEEVPLDENQQENTNEEKKKKKQKKLLKKKMNLKELGLQILAKKDWKKMRNRYLDMQRKSMKELKMHLNRQRFALRHDLYKPKLVIEPDKEVEAKVTSSTTEIEFIPNVIVKLALQEPCYTPKLLRNQIKVYSPDIKYVEIPFGSTEAFLRFGDSKSAEEFCASNLKDSVVLLQGEEEQNYWDKITESAAAKKEKQTKINKKRGRDKLLKKAEKHIANHIRFNDETDE